MRGSIVPVVSSRKRDTPFQLPRVAADGDWISRDLVKHLVHPRRPSGALQKEASRLGVEVILPQSPTQPHTTPYVHKVRKVITWARNARHMVGI